RRGERDAVQLPGEQALDVRRLAAALLAALALGAGWSSVAAAQTPGSAESEAPALLPRAPSDPNAISRPQSLDAPPPDHKLTGRQAQRIASGNAKVHAALRKYPKAKPEVFLKGPS